jgi:threonylcarbamoyladenosine tRNA methylthiotransferase MtaB
VGGWLRTVTLGCKVNQYETQLVREGLLSAGYQDAPADEPASLCVVNTCTVTSEGDAKSRQAIRRLHRENPDARIVVMGCYATRAPEEVARLPGVSEVVTDKREIPDLLGRHGVIDPPRGISGLAGRTRAFVKIQDGCLLRCSYCIIPLVRPQMRSRPQAEVVEEIRRLVDGGQREIVLTGIHLGHYGVDLNAGLPRHEWTRLATLLRELVGLDGRFRIRLSSIEATEITRELIDVMAENPDRICPHLHVCLQSGSDAVLRRMKRRWSVRQIIDRCHEVRDRLHRPAFSTDVIVGFPGESDTDFDATLRTCEAIGFMKIHCFPFSPRRGTPAATCADQIPPALLHGRCRQLVETELALRDRFLESLIGERVRLLVEKRNGPNDPWGLICRGVPAFALAPDVESGSLRGQFVDLEVSGFATGALIGSPLLP